MPFRCNAVRKLHSGNRPRWRKIFLVSHVYTEAIIVACGLYLRGYRGLLIELIIR